MAEAGQRIGLLLGGEGGAPAGGFGPDPEFAPFDGPRPALESAPFDGPRPALELAPFDGPRPSPEVGDEELSARGQRLAETGLLLDRPRAPFAPADEPRPLERELGEFVASLGAPAGGRRARRAQRVTIGKQASP